MQIVNDNIPHMCQAIMVTGIMNYSIPVYVRPVWILDMGIVSESE